MKLWNEIETRDALIKLGVDTTEGFLVQNDNYDEALDKLFGLTVFLYGGYYESKSCRDMALSDDLYEVWMKHRTD